MKKIKIVVMLVAVFVALYQQTLDQKNIYVMVGAIVVFMYGMMQLSARTPSKNQEKEEQDVE